MSVIFNKLTYSIRTDGLFYTIFRCLRYPVMWITSFTKRRMIFSSRDASDVFTKIYEVNWWGSNESISGHGSTEAYTENIRKELPVLFESLSTETVLDVPCGDFNWMSKVIESNDIFYIGGDIVPELVRKNQESYANDKTSFIVLNIISDKLPKADLLFCRDCFIHLSFTDIYLSLNNYLESGIPYIFTTTHINRSCFENTDIKTGDVRMIDLFSSPFFLPKEFRYRIKDWIKPHPEREMVLFEREQIIQSIPKMKEALGL